MYTVYTYCGSIITKISLKRFGDDEKRKALSVYSTVRSADINNSNHTAGIKHLQPNHGQKLSGMGESLLLGGMR